MRINTSQSRIHGRPLISVLIKELNDHSEELKLNDSYVYFDFPVFKDLDQEVVIAQLLIVSEFHGVLIFYVSDSIETEQFTNSVPEILKSQENLYSILFTRLLRNSELRNSKVSLKFPLISLIYAPTLKGKIENPFDTETVFCQNYNELRRKLASSNKVMDEFVFNELTSTLEGAKGLIRTKIRASSSDKPKGKAISDLEKEIVSFDQYQKSAYSSEFAGVSRIRGLAGSGKTVVLAIKAAITHLKHPEAKIAYTFYTKSLYQHIRRLITRFYRQYDDQDPNWKNLEVLHGWGSQSNVGIYYKACIENNITPLTYSDAVVRSKDAFSAACDDFLSRVKDPLKIYDFILIDEGQDFSPAFLKLCISITRDNNVIWAYDELQTIFRTNAPTPKEIFGENEKGESAIELEDDVILYKCYRNPRELLVVAHAVGFGIYSPKIAQMIENKEYWKDIGYTVESGDLKEGEHVKILRPESNSLKSISEQFPIDQIIRYEVFPEFIYEVRAVAMHVKEDIDKGLLPEDILIITVDDKYASSYLNSIQEILAKEYHIDSNNIHADKYSVKEFQIDGCVTLSTIHKAKGNEAYSVYIVGIDSLFVPYPSIRDRNILFTAMTRSKAWVYLSGLGKPAEVCVNEIQSAMQHFPYLEFDYPSESSLKIMKRDIKEKALRKSKIEKNLDELLEELTPEEITRYIEQRKKDKIQKEQK